MLWSQLLITCEPPVAFRIACKIMHLKLIYVFISLHRGWGAFILASLSMSRRHRCASWNNVTDVRMNAPLDELALASHRRLHHIPNSHMSSNTFLTLTLPRITKYEGVSKGFRNHPDVKEPENLFCHVILKKSLHSHCAKLHISCGSCEINILKQASCYKFQTFSVS